MYEIPSSPTPRRRFLGRIATAAAALGLSGGLASRLDAGTIEPSADPALDAWFGKIKGKHRMVFDASHASDGVAAIWPRVYLNTMSATYPGPATAMVVLRYKGLPLSMTDAVWAKYNLGELFNIKDGDAPAKRNPYATITGMPLQGVGIAELLKAGVLVGACDTAITVFSSGAARKMGLDPATVRDEWVAGLLPGVQIVPSGVLAIGRAQELGCGYCFAG
ncbi:MAG: hypothetical protein ACSLFK_14190 [Gemmatimonadaceae bacterium]